jgi:uncharacterized Zn finger protein (UPF0148 family)
MTTTAAVKLESVQCWCGAPMALPAHLVENARETGTALYCPATGHTFQYKSENARLRRDLEAERSRRLAVADQLKSSERRVAALKGEATKARRRAQAGVCPCCQRSFVQLSRHMKSKHPDFETEVR